MLLTTHQKLHMTKNCVSFGRASMQKTHTELLLMRLSDMLFSKKSNILHIYILLRFTITQHIFLNF